MLNDAQDQKPKKNEKEPATMEASGSPRPNESLGKYALAGWIILGLFFGIFGIWSLTAPLNGAVVATAIVKVQGNRKSVQHLDGGIVKQMNIKEGDRVTAGDVLIVLEDSQARSEFEVLSQQQIVLRATEVRLMAELARVSQLIAPPDIAARLDEPEAKSVWAAQTQQFQSRRAAIEGNRSVLREKINQLTAQITGNENQAAAYNEQIASVRKSSQASPRWSNAA